MAPDVKGNAVSEASYNGMLNACWIARHPGEIMLVGHRF